MRTSVMLRLELDRYIAVQVTLETLAGEAFKVCSCVWIDVFA